MVGLHQHLHLAAFEPHTWRIWRSFGGTKVMEVILGKAGKAHQPFPLQGLRADQWPPTSTAAPPNHHVLGKLLVTSWLPILTYSDLPFHGDMGTQLPTTSGYSSGYSVKLGRHMPYFTRAGGEAPSGLLPSTMATATAAAATTRRTKTRHQHTLGPCLHCICRCLHKLGCKQRLGVIISVS